MTRLAEQARDTNERTSNIRGCTRIRSFVLFGAKVVTRSLKLQQPVEVLAHAELRAIFGIRRGATIEHIPNEYVIKERHCRVRKVTQSGAWQYFSRLLGSTQCRASMSFTNFEARLS